MADPLTTFSLACGVAQIVSFTGEVFKLARTITEHGSPDPSLAEKATYLSTLSEKLQDTLVLQGLSGQALTKSQLELQKLSKGCLCTARAVTDEFSNTKWKRVTTSTGGSTHRIRNKFSQAFMTVRRKPTLDKLEKEMARAEQALQSGLVSELWFSREDAKKASQAPQFKGLNPELRQFINDWSDGHTKLIGLITKTTNDFREEARNEHSKTRQAMVSHLKTQESFQDAKAQYEQLMKSLDFGSMNQRRNDLRSAHEETFEWLYRNTSGNQWYSFPDWLNSDEKVYWIFGKAGSGKSTLMKYLVEDPQSLERLRKCGSETIIVSFFLWSVGSIEQRNVHGLLCSLLHQVLTAVPEMGSRFVSNHPDLRHKKSLTDWSIKGLKEALFWVIAALNRTLCIFLDGLDEIDRSSGTFDLIELINEFRASSAVKICISSRPEPALQKAFGHHPKLRLQDLTQRDIALVVDKFLGKLHSQNRMILADAAKKKSIVELVVERSAGVFLWVYLVLNSIQRGVVNIDSDSEILQRIRGLPTDLETLYGQMWQRHGEDEKIYQSEAARYFKIMLHVHGNHDWLHLWQESASDLSISLLMMTLACDEELQHALLEQSTMPDLKDILARVDRCRERIDVCCNGLLEIQPRNSHHLVSLLGTGANDSLENLLQRFLIPLSAYIPLSQGFQHTDSDRIPSGSELCRLWVASHHTKISFLHRSAADFLLESELGRRILKQDPDDESQCFLNLLRSAMSQRVLSPSTNLPHISALLRLAKNLPPEIAIQQRSACYKLARRLSERSPILDHLVERLKFQIQVGDHQGSWLRILIDFIKSIPGWCLPPFDALCKTNLADKTISSISQDLNSAASVATRHLASVFQSYGLFRGVTKTVALPVASPIAPKWIFPVPTEVYTQPGDSYSEQLVRALVYVMQATWLLTDGKRSTRRFLLSYFEIILKSLDDVSNRIENEEPHLWDRSIASKSASNLRLMAEYNFAFSPLKFGRLIQVLSTSQKPTRWSGDETNNDTHQLLHGAPTPFEVYLQELFQEFNAAKVDEAKCLGFPDIVRYHLAAGFDVQRIATVFIRLINGGEAEEHPFPAPHWTPWYQVDIETLKCNLGVVIQCSVGKLIDYAQRTLDGRTKNREFWSSWQLELEELSQEYLCHQGTPKVLLVCNRSWDRNSFDSKCAYAQPDPEQGAQLLQILEGALDPIGLYGRLKEEIAGVVQNSDMGGNELEECLRSQNVTVPKYQQPRHKRGEKHDRYRALFEEFEGDIVWRKVFPDAPLRTTVAEDDKAFKRMLKDCFGELSIISRRGRRRRRPRGGDESEPSDEE